MLGLTWCRLDARQQQQQELWINWTVSSEFGTYRLCEQRRFRRACASAQSRQNLRCSLIQAVNQEEPSGRKPDPWPLWMAGHAQLKFVMTECSKTQIRKFPKYSDTPKNYCNHPKSWKRWLFLTVMHPKDAEGIANSVDPDQTAPLGAVWSGSALFVQTCLSENLGKLWYLVISFLVLRAGCGIWLYQFLIIAYLFT